ncbi:MAG: SagB/ThcOx family dehydrogenase [Gemmatimonadota bacterium]
MPRRFMKYTLDAVLLGAAVVAFLTGLLVDRLGLHEFALHRWAGYVLAALVAVHVAVHWRFFLAPFAPRRQAAAAAPRDAAAGVASPAPERERSGPTRRTALAAAGAGAAGAAAGWFVKAEISPDPYPGGDVGLFYHRESSLGLRSLLRSVVDWGSRPAAYKRVAGGPAVALPAALPLPEMSVGQALQQRRSLRRYRDRMLTARELAWLVHAATAITSGAGYRTAPSAGALYPIETYVAVSRVEGIGAGLYHVDVRAQALELVRAGSVAGDLMIAGLGQEFLGTAPAVFVFTGLFQRTRWKYHERHYRYIAWEGGHIAQNVYLAAEAAGLGACMVGAFFDGLLNSLLQIDGRREAALGLVTVGPR